MLRPPTSEVATEDMLAIALLRVYMVKNDQMKGSFLSSDILTPSLANDKKKKEKKTVT